MEAKKLLSILEKHPLTNTLKENWNKPSGYTNFKGLHGSSGAIWLSLLFKHRPKPVLCILEDKEAAAYFHNDLSSFITDEKLSFFPTSYQRSIRHEKTDPANIILRTDTLNQARLHSRQGQAREQHKIGGRDGEARHGQ